MRSWDERRPACPEGAAKARSSNGAPGLDGERRKSCSAAVGLSAAPSEMRRAWQASPRRKISKGGGRFFCPQKIACQKDLPALSLPSPPFALLHRPASSSLRLHHFNLDCLPWRRSSFFIFVCVCCFASLFFCQGGGHIGGLARAYHALQCKPDSEGIRTPAGRAQSISSPSP